jgi:hypothetical protein
MNAFTYFAMLGGLGVVMSFYFGARAMAHYGDQCGRTCWAWRSVFMTCVFVTILSAPLA